MGSFLPSHTESCDAIPLSARQQKLHDHRCLAKELNYPKLIIPALAHRFPLQAWWPTWH